MSQSRALYTRKDVEAELRATQQELHRLGLLTPGVKNVPLKTPLTDAATDLAYARYICGWSWWLPLYGLKVGDLMIPLFSAQRGFDRLVHRRPSFRHTLRHELGHALAYTSPARLIRQSPEFIRAFGAHHEATKHVVSRRSDLLTSYCGRNPAEDFAETFAWYVRARGKIECMKSRLAVYQKLKFVESLRKRI